MKVELRSTQVVVAEARRGKSGQSSHNFLPEVKVSLPERRSLRQERPSLGLQPDDDSMVEDLVRFQEPAAQVCGGQLLPVPRDRVQLRGFP